MIRILRTTLKNAIYSYPILSKMVLEKGSYMDAHIQSVKQKIGAHDFNPVFLLFEEGKLAAWLELYGPENQKVNVFVHPDHRRKGFGSKLIEQALLDSGRDLLVYPYDTDSKSFYDNLAANSKNRVLIV